MVDRDDEDLLGDGDTPPWELDEWIEDEVEGLDTMTAEDRAEYLSWQAEELSKFEFS